MKKTFLLAGAAGMLLAACSQDKPVTTETTAPTLNPDSVEVTNMMDSTYQVEANRIAQQIAQDANLTDTAVVQKVQVIHYDRARRLEALRNQYAQDTTGRYVAVRRVNDSAVVAVQAVLPTAQYNTYSSNLGSYYEGPYTVVGVGRPVPTAASTPRGPKVVSYEKDGGDVKIEYANGTTVKIDKDGDRKIKYANGTKVKVDEDGERKTKYASGRKVKVDEDGERKVKK